MTDQTNQQADQKLIVPTELWKQMSGAIGSFAWSEVHNLRQAVQAAFGDSGIDVANTVSAPAQMQVSVDLFNNASNYLGSKPHDLVDGVMSNISNFITMLQQQAADAIAKAEAPAPVVDAAPVVAAASDVTDVAYTETSGTPVSVS